VRYVRIYTDGDGETHFGDVDVEGARQRSSVSQVVAEVAPAIPAQGIVFRRVIEEDDSGAPHNAPRVQFVIHLAGESEIEVSDGETRRFGPGSVVLVEDTTGKGHVTRGVGGEERVTLFVALPQAPQNP
jgi:hypothetical protein